LEDESTEGAEKSDSLPDVIQMASAILIVIPIDWLNAGTGILIGLARSLRQPRRGSQGRENNEIS
jgi:hypothetical protein